MSVDQIPDVVQRLIREQVRSYDALEVLLLLHRGRAQAWRPADVAAALRLPEDAAGAALADLADVRLLVATSTAGALAFRVDVARVDVAAIEQLAAAWDQHRLAMIKLMNASALERLRTGAARALSDAFLFTKRRNDG
jgi:hypothetical protein